MVNQVQHGRAPGTRLEDLLFSYGVRINTDLLLDASCAPSKSVHHALGNQQSWSFSLVF